MGGCFGALAVGWAVGCGSDAVFVIWCIEWQNVVKQFGLEEALLQGLLLVCKIVEGPVDSVKNCGVPVVYELQAWFYGVSVAGMSEFLWDVFSDGAGVDGDCGL